MGEGYQHIGKRPPERKYGIFAFSPLCPILGAFSRDYPGRELRAIDASIYMSGPRHAGEVPPRYSPIIPLSIDGELYPIAPWGGGSGAVFLPLVWVTESQ